MVSLDQSVKQDQEAIKYHNKKMVLDIIREHRPITRSELSKRTGMSAMSIGRIVAELCEEGLIEETSLTSGSVGRKAVKWDIVPDGRYAIGVDIQRRQLVIGVMNLAETLVHSRNIECTTQSMTPDQTVTLLAGAIGEMLEALQISSAKVVAIGIGIPGVVDHENGIVSLSEALGWRQVPLVQKVEQLTGIRTIVDNDLKVKILGEYLYGSAQGSDKAVLIHVGKGIGSSLILNGRVFRGDANSAGELGHMTLEPLGTLCECGKRGCLQMYIDDRALLSEARKAGQPMDEITQLFDAARNGDGWAAELLDRAALYISVTINNIMCLYNSETVILSGNFVEQYEPFLGLVHRYCAGVVWEPFRSSLNVIASELKERAIILGAGALALQQTIRNERGITS